MKKIKLLVVDDSILFREVLARYIRQDNSIQVVGTAGDAYVARDMILRYEPDVMTLDIEMPRMDGVNFLRKLLPQYYIPTIVVSSLDQQEKAAKEAGAAEFLTKPMTRTNADMQKFAIALCNAIKRAYKENPAANPDDTEQPAAQPAPAPTPAPTAPPPVRTAPAAPAQSAAANPAPSAAQPSSSSGTSRIRENLAGVKRFRKTDVVIALGASTGGTEALEKVIKGFPEDVPPVLVVQHMPAGFTKMYSERLNRSCRPEVKEAEDGDRLRRGLVIIGAGDNHLRLCKDAKGYYVSSKNGPKVSGHCPSVDVLFTSVAEVARGNAIGAIMTGMGRDGADGLLKMRQAGAFTIGQDKETCVVYGMPMEAYNIGAVQIQAPIYDIARIIMDQLF